MQQPDQRAGMGRLGWAHGVWAGKGRARAAAGPTLVRKGVMNTKKTS